MRIPEFSRNFIPGKIKKFFNAAFKFILLYLLIFLNYTITGKPFKF